MPHRLDNWTFVYRSPIALLLLAAITTGCEKAIDPQTGDTAMRLTVPGTSANETARQQRWRRCIQFRSESFCDRSVPGGRPAGAAGPPPTQEQTPAERDNDP